MPLPSSFPPVSDQPPIPSANPSLDQLHSAAQALFGLLRLLSLHDQHALVEDLAALLQEALPVLGALERLAHFLVTRFGCFDLAPQVAQGRILSEHPAHLLGEVP